MFAKTINKFKPYAVPTALFLVAFTIFSLITMPKIGSLYSFSDTTYIQAGVTSGKEVIRYAQYLPLRGFQYIGFKLDSTTYSIFRTITVLFLLFTAIALYSVLQKWHTRRIAIAGIVLFITSSYVLLISRSGSAEVMYLSIFPALFMIGTWLKSKKYVHRMPFASVILAILLYIPGSWFVILLPSILFRKRLLLAWKHVSKKSRSISIGLCGILLLPLIYSFVVVPSNITLWLGYTNSLSITSIWDNFSSIVPSLFISGPENNIWISGTPIIDIFVACMFFLGIVGYTRGHHPLRMRMLFGYIGLSIIMISLSMAPIALLLPLVYIVATNGIARMLQSWFVVFPKNPIARNTGVVLVVIAVILSCRYQLIRYYDAMPLVAKNNITSKMIQYR